MFRPVRVESFSGERPHRFNDFFKLIHRAVDVFQRLVEDSYEYFLRFLFTTIVQYCLGALAGLLLLYGIFHLGAMSIRFFFG